MQGITGYIRHRQEDPVLRGVSDDDILLLVFEPARVPHLARSVNAATRMRCRVMAQCI